MTDKITVPATITVGTLDELGLSLDLHWAGAIQGDAQFNVSCGAGMGHMITRFSYHEGDVNLYAELDMGDLAKAVWSQLRERAQLAAFLADTGGTAVAVEAELADTGGTAVAVEAELRAAQGPEVTGMLSVPRNPIAAEAARREAAGDDD